MDEQEAEAPDVDGDRLARVGWTLVRAQKWIAPITVVNWLKRRPSHNRLAIAVSVLMVSWNPTPDEPPPDPALVEDLLTVHDSLPFDVVSDNYLLKAPLRYR